MHYQLIKETFPAARKPHRCIWCGESILVGEKHRHEKSTFNGFQDFRWHIECHESADFSEGPEFAPHENERPEKRTGADTP